MKFTSGFFALVLMLWMGGSTYYYVCKIKKDCEKNKATVIYEIQKPETESIEKKEIVVEEPAEKSKKEIIEELKEKITAGYTVYDFPKNSNTNNNIKSDFVDFANNLKLYLSENPSQKIEIIGYTDNTGSAETNIFFGKKRALFIKNKLTEVGISGKHFIVKSQGEKNPIASNNTEAGRNKNRRVVIKLIN